MDIIDTHQHLWDPQARSYPWCKGIPQLNRAFTLKDYREASRRIPVVKTVFIECDTAETSMLEEARAFLALAEEASSKIAGVVAACRPEHDTSRFRRHVEQIVSHRKLKGLRRVLHVVPDETSQSDVFIENICSLLEYNLSYDICVGCRQLPLALNLVRQCPNVPFILDHCGVPDIKNRQMDPWRDHIHDIARCANVACKVSGLVTSADPGTWTAGDLRPFVEHVIECFGWDRVMFGSDWPVCTLASTYRRWMDAALELVAKESEDNQRKFFSKNAERIYRLS